MKFKGAWTLDPRGLVLLESILQLRNDTARHKDRPPFKILGNEPIMEIVRRKPLTERDLGHIKGLSSRQIKVLGLSILKKTRESLALPENQLPSFPGETKQRGNTRLSKEVKVLRSWRAQRAKDMDIDPALLCTNTQIKSMALAFTKNQKDLKGIDTLRAWQRRLYGREICDLLKKEERSL